MIRRRTAAALVLAALLTPLAGVAHAQDPEVLSLATQGQPRTQVPAPADGCERASAEAPVVVDVTTLAPRAPRRADEPLQVSGRLLNCGPDALRDVEVRLGVGQRLDTRLTVAAADAEPVVGRRVAIDDSAVPLAPGASQPFDLRLLTGALQLGRRNGVFPLTVQARARVGAESARGQVGLAHTFLPWFPDGPIAPTRLAWLVPLVDRPHRAPGEVMLDDELNALLENGQPDRGRLQRALIGARVGAQGACDPSAAPPEGSERDSAVGCRREPVPVTYALDPDLLYSVEAMTRGYTVQQRGKRVDRPASPNAEQWLVGLRAAATGGADVLALPYGDPDVVALTRSGSPLRDDVESLRRLGQRVTGDLLGTAPLASVAWLPPGPVGGAVDTLAGGEVRTLLIDPAALPPLDPFRLFTPSARTTLRSSAAGEVGALVIDEGLSRLVEPDPSDAGWQGPRLAEQRWIAEAAVLAAELPSVSRTFLVAPRREADLIPSVLAGALFDTGRLPFLCPVSLADASAGTERCTPGGLVDDQGPAVSTPRGAPLLAGPADRQLSKQTVERLGEVRAASDQFTDQVLIAGSAPADAAKARLLRARGRAESQAWRTQPREGREQLELLADDITDLRGKVRLLNARPVLLTGRVGTVSLSVENGLDQPVNVGVGLPSSRAARVQSRDTALQVVPPRRAVDVQVRVEARTSGRFQVPAALLDAEGRRFGPLVQLQVRSTQYGQVALAVTGVAAAVLLIAAGVRITRRALRRDRAAPDTEPAVTPAAPGSGI